ncbi:O-antigen ligase family protein [Lachnospiraceae bacterium YH-ros2226]
MKTSQKHSKKSQSIAGGDNLLVYLFEISPFLLGLASIYTSLFAGILVAVSFLILIATRKECRFYWNRTTLAGGLILLGSLLSIFFGVDYGTGLEGFAVILSAAVFGFLLMQVDPKTRKTALHTMPETGFALLLVSLFLCAFPKTRNFVILSGRLNGLFQYANVCALYLLLCLSVLLWQNGDRSHEDGSKGKKAFRLFLLPAALMGGILWTGSRYTFLLTLAVVVWSLIKYPLTRKTLAVLTGLVLAAAIVYVLVTGNVASIGRFVTISGKSSTFVGRLLYWMDALPVIVRHPFGLGYLGYHQMEGLFQRGYYEVKFVHNEYLQAFLDYGWIGGIGFVTMIIHGLRKSRGLQRLLLVLISLHMIMDWDLQFFPMIWILLLELPWEEGKCFSWEWSGFKTKSILTTTCLVYICLSAWIGIGDALDYAGHPDVAWKIYPLDYKYAMAQVYAARDYDTAEEFAESVLKLDPYNSSVYVLYMNEANAKGDYQAMIRYGKKAAALSPYQNEILSNYVEKLGKAIDSYKESGETAQCDKAITAVSEIKKLLIDTKASTNPLAWRIKDKPKFTLTEDAEKILRAYAE